MAEQQQINVQINCPYLQQMIMNGQQLAMCQLVKQNISNSIGEYCLGDKCTILKYEPKETTKIYE